ncbi:hypothetical protein [Chelatococcus sp. XZ-Ab1]|uniref:hypothetical protein n=1 Tax=Chelatococcus sp. XZ-Ab1 TaxID=3034027 RepID=UPI0023E428E9|nr:hypothetical protein [Chelatococcus sp. XZ-Ab1]
MALAIQMNGQWERWDGWLGEARHNTLDVERCWSPAELEDAGLAVIQPALIPPGKVPVGQSSLVDDGGAPREVYALEDEPLRPLTARQLRLGLITNGIALSDVEAAIGGVEDETERAAAQVEWEYASEFVRHHPLIDQIGAALGLTPAQIDTMWQGAQSL